MLFHLGYCTLLGMAGLAYAAESTCKEMKGYECGSQFYSDAELMDPTFIKRDLGPWEVDLSAVDSETNVNVTDLLLRRRDLLHDLEGDALHDQIEALIAEQEGGDEGRAVSVYHMLTRRGGKNDYQICKDSKPVTYWVPSYPDGTVYYDNVNWKDCTNFNFMKDPPNLTAKRYIAEHVLERQMLQQFSISVLEGKPLAQAISGLAGTDNEYCKMFDKYWVPKTPSDSNDKAIVVKKNGNTIPENINAWDNIGNAWPSKNANQDEMLRTENQINLMKARAFNQEVGLVDADKMRKAAKLGENAKFTNFLKIASQTVKYLDHKDVQATLKKQGDRVAEAFKASEDALAANWANEPEPYVRQGLDKLWLAWIKEYMEEVNEKFERNMNLWNGFVNNAINDADDKKVKNKLSKREKKFVEEMKKTRAEINQLTAREPMFGNPWA